MAVVSPKAARVFLCGEPYAGKTTLRRKSMMYSTSHPTMKLAGSCVNLISRMPFMERLLHGSELRTRGVEVNFLVVGNTHMTLWDLAGQKEFHAFHDLVVPNLSGGGSSSLFLLVCNPFDNSMNVKPNEDIKNELQYWLQFIASNLT
ncbi:hypothetical protein O6H91_22G069200 [Diphasiastrum complanatum]|uniref:Uncharacterized protein n=1 Tax=Diphasiastrum complanatum TaxID=34168 RepID=A0ACC2AGP3_DIPCM|nr:hypothetical protein O6H91_22G069200 [Diphasiastrum complanatum]